MRPLDLHISALNDAEYELYTSSLADITLDDDQTTHDDQFYQQLSIGVREVRAWLRGRYSQLPASTVDTIVKFFSPSLAQSDSLSGGQFFAALRLVVHAQTGKPVDRALAFVQAYPNSSEPAASIDVVSPLPDPSQPFPQRNGVNNPFVARSKSMTSSRSEDSPSRLPPLPPRKPSQAGIPPPRHASLLFPSTNPSPGVASKSTSGPPSLLRATSSHMTSTLMKQSLQASKAGQTLKKAEEQLEKERIMQVLKRSTPAPPARNRSTSPNKRSTSSSHSSEDAPPIPRRKAKQPSPPTSTGSMERVALANTNYHDSPFKSPIPYESSQISPSHPSVDLPCGPPPKHPDRKPPAFTIPSQHHRTTSFGHSQVTVTAEPEPFEMVYGPSPASASPQSVNFRHDSPDSPPTRMVRSKSLHHASPPNSMPLPPPRRKRPESFQTPSPVSSVFSDDVHSRKYHQRQSSSNFTSPTQHDSPLTNIQRTLANLQPKLDALQPKLDKARYKAEAGLSRRGFVRDGHTVKVGPEGEEEEGLMDSREDIGVFDDKFAVNSQLNRMPSKDDLWDEDKDSWVGVEEENTKWPVDAGWKPL